MNEPIADLAYYYPQPYCGSGRSTPESGNSRA
jgi:hypothetical protein